MFFVEFTYDFFFFKILDKLHVPIIFILNFPSFDVKHRGRTFISIFIRYFASHFTQQNFYNGRKKKMCSTKMCLLYCCVHPPSCQQCLKGFISCLQLERHHVISENGLHKKYSCISEFNRSLSCF